VKGTDVTALEEIQVQRPPRDYRDKAEWDWFRDLSFGDRMLVYRHSAPKGMEPDGIATVACMSVDSAMKRWLTLIKFSSPASSIGHANQIDDLDDEPESDARQVSVRDLVGPAEVAERLCVNVRTVTQWKYRGLLPEPLAIVSGVPLYEWEEIAEWAVFTGRSPQ